MVDDRSDDHLPHRKAMSEAAFDGAKGDYGGRTGVSNILMMYAAFGGAKGDYGRRTRVSNILVMYAAFDGAKGDIGRMI